MYAEIIGAAVALGMLLVGLFAGGFTQRRHFASLDARERALRHVLVTDVRNFPGGELMPGAAIVVAEVVIATDYFKSFCARLRKLVGGEMRGYQSLMTRARREAVLRLMEQAQAIGCNAVCNLRLDTADVAGIMRRGSTTVCIIAIGTAYRAALAPSPTHEPAAA